eukprot:scaffold1044_cov120-Isochrysis_galbana.AAC.5
MVSFASAIAALAQAAATAAAASAAFVNVELLLRPLGFEPAEQAHPALADHHGKASRARCDLAKGEDRSGLAAA